MQQYKIENVVSKFVDILSRSQSVDWIPNLKVQSSEKFGLIYLSKVSTVVKHLSHTIYIWPYSSVFAKMSAPRVIVMNTVVHPYEARDIR